MLTFGLINFSWIFFRANSLSDAFQIIGTIFTNPGRLYIGDGADITAPVYALLAVFLMLIVEVTKEFMSPKYVFLLFLGGNFTPNLSFYPGQ
mgnify:CR=1 FL=1